MTIDRRTLPIEDPDAILADLIARVTFDVRTSQISNADQIRVEGSVDMVMPGFRTEPDSLLAAVASETMEALGRPGEPTGWTAACEGGYLSAHHGVPTIILGPGDINEQAHQPDERVEVTDLVLAAEAYVRIILGLATDETKTEAV